MKRYHQFVLAGVAVAAVPCLALAGPWAASAKARSLSIAGGGEVNVNVGFSTQMPLDDTTDQTLASTQKRGRTFIYRMAREECTVLKSTIAETCRLAGINVNAQLRNQYNNQPVTLYLNGNANYLISLKKF